MSVDQDMYEGLQESEHAFCVEMYILIIFVKLHAYLTNVCFALWLNGVLDCVLYNSTAWFGSQTCGFYKGRELSGVVTGLAC